ncbi:MAG TPA: alpha/beta hydrolase, partial [Chloroflexi bacterium]|nr:alpha/beta hydrolase [Chloroflexota bacterium]
MERPLNDVRHEEGIFWAADGLCLFEQFWHPTTAPRGVVVMIHGHGDHSGRYASLGEFLAQEGYAAEAMDLRGHGRSQGPRAFVWSFDEYVNDVERFLERVRRRYPGAPLFLLGHSMGGTVVTLLALNRRSSGGGRSQDPAGLILCSAAVRVSDHVSPLLVRLAPLLGRLLPRMSSLRLDSAAISRDPAVVEAARVDPLMYHGGMKARTGAELHRAITRIQLDMERLTLPLLIMHGTDDAIVEVTGSEEIYQRAGSKDKMLLLYRGFYHELF